MFNVNDVNTEYCVKDGQFIYSLIFIQSNDILFKNYDLRTSDVNKTSIIVSKLIILHSKGTHRVYAFFWSESDQWTKFRLLLAK